MLHWKPLNTQEAQFTLLIEAVMNMTRCRMKAKYLWSVKLEDRAGGLTPGVFTCSIQPSHASLTPPHVSLHHAKVNTTRSEKYSSLPEIIIRPYNIHSVMKLVIYSRLYDVKL